MSPTTDARPSETVLLVEDEPLVRALGRYILREAGYAVVEAENGDDAIAAFGAAEVDAIISDVGLPDTTGPELVTRLRQQVPGVAVVLVSGYVGEARVVASDFSAVTTFVQKPFTKAGLLGALRTVLDNRQLAIP